MLVQARDKKIIEMDTIIAQKKQSKEAKNLQKEIEANRKDLDNVIRGDKQKLRNTLAEHREMQLAFQNAQPQVSSKAEFALELLSQ